MKKDTRIPSQTTDTFWIFVLNTTYQFQKPKEQRASGKWLIFEPLTQLDDTWGKIKEATYLGQLGPSSKVSTAKPNPNAKDSNMGVICVFTEDFNNVEDVERIEKKIRKLGIQNKLIYKLDKDVGKYAKDGHSDLIKKISTV